MWVQLLLGIVDCLLIMWLSAIVMGWCWILYVVVRDWWKKRHG